MKAMAKLQVFLLALALVCVIGLAVKNCIVSFSFARLGMSILYVVMIWTMLRISIQEYKESKSVKK